jgi:hypothetical protein
VEQGIKALAGPVFFGVCALLIFAIACVMWPAEFFGTPFPGMTTGILLRAVASLILGFIGLEFLAALAIVVLSDNQ